MLWLMMTVMAMFIAELTVMSMELCEIFGAFKNMDNSEFIPPSDDFIKSLDKKLNKWIERHVRVFE